MRGWGQAGALMLLPWEGGAGDGKDGAGEHCQARLALFAAGRGQGW